MQQTALTNHSIIIGWREWIALPELGIAGIKAKIDTGARTSALHTFMIEPYEADGVPWVRFGIHPLQRRTEKEIFCRAAIKDERLVTDSGGHREMRYVIETAYSLGGLLWSAEISLTNRDTMRFRMLMGRTALQDRFLVVPSGSYLTGRRLSKPHGKKKKKREKSP
ncbi:MAG: ATP-dependent zinc protease [Desulfobacterales bacterium]|nr:ATP-dependent zinc protease [Desulfobacterales bacterium]